MKRVSLFEQIARISECGIHLRNGVTENDLLRSFDRKFYEEGPYKRLLAVLGGEERFSEDILLLDTECIEGDGSYVRVLSRMAAMTHGALPLTDWKDSLNDPNAAWVQFRLQGRTQRWSVELNGDWIDPSILGRMASLLAQQQKALQYVSASAGGQTALIACLTRENTKRLSELSGLEFRPLIAPDQQSA